MIGAARSPAEQILQIQNLLNSGYVFAQSGYDLSRPIPTKPLAKELGRRKGKEGDLLRRIVEASPDIIYTFDLRQRKTRAFNDSVERVLGYAGDVPLCPCDAALEPFVHPEDADEAGATLGMLTGLVERQSAEVTFRIKCADGHWRWLLHHIVVLSRGRDGQIDRLLGIATDVTARMNAEREFQSLSADVPELISAERRRIAAELHDSTAQHLAAISLGLAQLKRLIALTPQAKDVMSDISTSIDEAAREIRAFSYLMHPPHVEEHGLVGALSDFTHGFAKRTGLQVNTDLPGDLGELSCDVRVAIFRIVQEALMNVHRHAKAATAGLSLSVVDRVVRLRIWDDGEGISCDQTGRPPMGVGLRGMRDRVERFGGTLTFDSARGGTRIEAGIPI